MILFKNAIFYATLVITALCVIAVYAHSVIGFAVLPAFAFMLIIIAIAYNGGK